MADFGITTEPRPKKVDDLLSSELMAKLDALTNLRVVRDPTASTGWKLDVGPFPGWKDVPTW